VRKSGSGKETGRSAKSVWPFKGSCLDRVKNQEAQEEEIRGGEYGQELPWGPLPVDQKLSNLLLNLGEGDLRIFFPAVGRNAKQVGPTGSRREWLQNLIGENMGEKKV